MGMTLNNERTFFAWATAPLHHARLFSQCRQPGGRAARRKPNHAHLS